jgi:hypothetical protein
MAVYTRRIRRVSKPDGNAPTPSAAAICVNPTGNRSNAMKVLIMAASLIALDVAAVFSCAWL